MWQDHLKWRKGDIYTEKNSEIKVMEGRNRSVLRCVKEQGRKRQERHRKLQIGAEK